MNLNNIWEKIWEKIRKKVEISTFLFVGNNLELLNSEIKKLANSLLQDFEIPKINFFILEDDGEKIKIEKIKDFFSFSRTKTSYKFQIFFIENITRMTNQASSSCLKLFEEPWIQNIIFLSSNSENLILETILSRVQIIHSSKNIVSKKNNFYYDLIKQKKEFISYIFKNKLEKEEQVKILENILLYLINNSLLTHKLDELQNDLDMLKQNNVNTRWILDKRIFKI